jgi:hypothetical protein
MDKIVGADFLFYARLVRGIYVEKRVMNLVCYDLGTAREVEGSNHKLKGKLVSRRLPPRVIVTLPNVARSPRRVIPVLETESSQSELTERWGRLPSYALHRTPSKKASFYFVQLPRSFPDTLNSSMLLQFSS